MLLAFADPPTPRERGQQQLMHPAIERRELQPLLQVGERLVVGNAAHELLQQCRVAAAKPPPLRDQPAVEARAAVDLQTVQEVALDQPGEGSLLVQREGFHPALDRAGDIDRIDTAIGEVEPDGVVAGLDPPAAGLVHQAPDLAEAPAKLAARVVGNVPQELAQLAARDRQSRQRPIGKQGTYIERGLERQGPAVPGDRQGAQQLHLERIRGAVSARPRRFHGLFHAGYHARLHVRALRRKPDGHGRSDAGPNDRSARAPGPTGGVMVTAAVSLSQNRPPIGQADLGALKVRQRVAWSAGDYAVIGTTLQVVGEELCEAIDIRAGQKVLDVAAGNGNATLAAARRWCDVVSVDYVPALLARGRERAAAERLDVEFREAEPEAQPVTERSLDAALSTVGV